MNKRFEWHPLLGVADFKFNEAVQKYVTDWELEEIPEESNGAVGGTA